MNRRNLIRIITLLLFLLLSIYFVENPVFKDSELSKQDGESVPLYFFEVTGKSGDGYIVREGTSKKEIEVVTDAQLEIGGIASFYGTVESGRLIVQKHHLHTHPGTRVYLSIFGLTAFLVLMTRRETFA
ncbi:hypothetical protein KKA03_04600 [archaeon]|nr:hypothetical protein [archaeon]